MLAQLSTTACAARRPLLSGLSRATRKGVASAAAELPPLEPKYGRLKEKIRPPPQILHESWCRLQDALESNAKHLAKHPEDAWPEVQFDDVCHNSRFSPHLALKIRKRGVLIVRDTFREERALKWRDQLLDYVKDCPDTSGPRHDRSLRSVFWSKPALQARQDENMFLVQKLLNRLWTQDPLDNTMDPDKCVTYVDRIRWRSKPATYQHTGMHMADGSIERWEDSAYREVYRSILKGNWEQHDAFYTHKRANASFDLHHSPYACGFFRTFQGLTMLSNMGPEDGTLQVAPALNLTIAYVMLRPFLDDVPENDFPGAHPGLPQGITSTWHQPLLDLVQNCPHLKPGDTVWWHPDSVFGFSGSDGQSSDVVALQIPSAPMCKMNAWYLKAQRLAMQKGDPPPDFQMEGISESSITERGRERHLSFYGRYMLGLDPWPRETSLAQQCERILGF